MIPVLLRETLVLEDLARLEEDPLARTLNEIQRLDWRAHRHKTEMDADLGRDVNALAEPIVQRLWADDRAAAGGTVGGASAATGSGPAPAPAKARAAPLRRRGLVLAVLALLTALGVAGGYAFGLLDRGDPAGLCNEGLVTGVVRAPGNDGTLYEVHYDFSRGAETGHPGACGREYWVKGDPAHANHAIRFVYLVRADRTRVVETLFIEGDDGILRPL